MTLFKKNPRRSTYVSPQDDKRERRAARQAGERRQRDDERSLVGKIDQSNPDWADFD